MNFSMYVVDVAYAFWCTLRVPKILTFRIAQSEFGAEDGS